MLKINQYEPNLWFSSSFSSSSWHMNRLSVFSWQIIEFLNDWLEFFGNLLEFFFGLSFFGLEFFSKCPKKAWRRANDRYVDNGGPLPCSRCGRRPWRRVARRVCSRVNTRNLWRRPPRWLCSGRASCRSAHPSGTTPAHSSTSSSCAAWTVSRT